MMASEESDISETSNSWCVSCRWNVSAGPDAVGMSSMPSGLMVPSMMGRLRGLGANARLNVGLVVMERSFVLVGRAGEGRSAWGSLPARSDRHRSARTLNSASENCSARCSTADMGTENMASGRNTALTWRERGRRRRRRGRWCFSTRIVRSARFLTGSLVTAPARRRCSDLALSG